MLNIAQDMGAPLACQRFRHAESFLKGIMHRQTPRYGFNAEDFWIDVKNANPNVDVTFEIDATARYD